jgi:subtilisin family serine protease
MKRSRFFYLLHIAMIACLVTVVSGAVSMVSAQRNPDRVEPKKPPRHGGKKIRGLIGAFGPLVIQGLRDAEKDRSKEKTKKVRRTPPKRTRPEKRRARTRETAPPRVAVIPPLPVLPPEREPPQFIADTPPTPLSREAAIGDQPEFRANEVVLLIRGDQPDLIAEDIEDAADLVLQDTITLTLLNSARIYRFGIPDGRTVDAVLAEVGGTPGVESAGPNTYYRLQGEAGGGAHADQQYALPKMRIPDTQKLVQGNGITVAVIDSAADLSHPALKDANLSKIDALKEGVYEPHEHGTAIAGIIAASGDMIGIAPNAKLISVRAFAPEKLGSAPITTVFALMRAVDEAFVAGARIFNMSFAGAENQLFIDIIDDAYGRGAIFVAAAGNEGPNAPPAYPAAHDKVIAITATDESDEIFEGANRGGYVLAAAPGVEIFAPVTNNGFDFLSGTSFAAAHVTGVIALLMERNPKLTAENIRSVLVEAAHDLGPVGQDNDFGAGLTNAYDALQLVSHLE